MSQTPSAATGFADLLANNEAYAVTHGVTDLPAPAAAHVFVVTCMDSRIDPLAMLGLGLGDAKVYRNPGGRVTEGALEAAVLATNLLGATRIMVVEHTKCAVASSSEDQLRERVAQAMGVDATGQAFHVVEDQQARLESDVAEVRGHALVPTGTEVGGFIYDVDTGRLSQVV